MLVELVENVVEVDCVLEVDWVVEVEEDVLEVDVLVLVL